MHVFPSDKFNVWYMLPSDKYRSYLVPSYTAVVSFYHSEPSNTPLSFLKGPSPHLPSISNRCLLYSSSTFYPHVNTLFLEIINNSIAMPIGRTTSAYT